MSLETAVVWLPAVIAPITLIVWLVVFAFIVDPVGSSKGARRFWWRSKHNLAALLGNGVALMLGGLALGGLMSALAPSVLSQGWVSETFFATTAQINPVFIVALAVEQRLVDRLGVTEEQYVGNAEKAIGYARDALVDVQTESDGAERLAAEVEALPDMAWVWEHAEDTLHPDPWYQPDIAALARSRYRAKRRGQGLFVIGAIVALLVGQLGAILGLLQGGAETSALVFRVTLGGLIATTMIVTAGALRELALGIRVR